MTADVDRQLRLYRTAEAIRYASTRVADDFVFDAVEDLERLYGWDALETGGRLDPAKLDARLADLVARYPLLARPKPPAAPALPTTPDPASLARRPPRRRITAGRHAAPKWRHR